MQPRRHGTKNVTVGAHQSSKRQRGARTGTLTKFVPAFYATAMYRKSNAPASRKRPSRIIGADLAAARKTSCTVAESERQLVPWRGAAFDIVRLADESRYLSEPPVRWADGYPAEISAESKRALACFRDSLLNLKLALWDACERVAAGFVVPIPARVFKLCTETKKCVFDGEPLPDLWSTPEYREALRGLLDDPDRTVYIPDKLYERWREFANTYPDTLHAVRKTERKSLDARTDPNLSEPVCVVKIAEDLPKGRDGGRSDKLAEKLRRRGARLQKLGGKWYVERDDAMRLLPAWRRWVEEHADA